MPVLDFHRRQDINRAQGDSMRPLDASRIQVEIPITVSFSLLLITVVTVLRFYTKVVHHQKIRIDDYFIILSALVFTAFLGVLFSAASAGQGLHAWDLPIEAFQKALLFDNILNILYAPCVLFIKLALLFQLARFRSAIPKQILRWVIHILVLFNILAYTVVCFVNIFACTPRAKISNDALSGNCLPGSATKLIPGIFDIASNSSILFLAFAIVPAFPISRKIRLAAILAFAVGILAFTANLVKFYYSLRLLNDDDRTRAAYPVSMSILAELTCLIVIASSLALSQVFPNPKSSKTNRALKRHTHIKWVPANETPKTSEEFLTEPKLVRKWDSESTLTTTASPPFPTEFNVPPTQPTSPLDPHIITFEPIEHPISHLSYNSSPVPSAVGKMEDDVPVSPISAMTNYTLPQLHFATEISVTPVQAANNTKTVDVTVHSKNSSAPPPVSSWIPDPRW